MKGLSGNLSVLSALIVAKVVEFVAENADDVLLAIKEKFSKVLSDNIEVSNAAHDLAYEPSEEKLQKFSELLEQKGEDPEKLASLLVTKTIV